MPTPVATQMGRIVDAVESVSGLSPTTALLLGVLLGIGLGVGAMFWLRGRVIELRKEEQKPPL